MNNRWNQRTAVKLSVALQYAPLGLIMGKTRDISVEGMFVETGRILIYPNEIVAVSFCYPYGDERRVINTDATVRHIGPNGIGLMFEEFKFELLEQDEPALLMPAYH